MRNDHAGIPRRSRGIMFMLHCADSPVWLGERFDPAHFARFQAREL